MLSSWVPIKIAPVARIAGRLPEFVASAFPAPVRLSRHAARWVLVQRVLHLPLALTGSPWTMKVTLDGHPLEVLLMGRVARFRDLTDAVFDVPAAPQLLPGRRWLIDPQGLRAAGGAAGAALTAVEIHPGLAPCFRAAGWTVWPTLVRWRAPLWNIPPSPPGHSLKEDLRRVRVRGYRLEEAAGTRREWDAFFDGMVAPFAQQRFGPAATSISWSTVCALRRRGRLLYVKDGDRRVAGVGALSLDQELWLPVLGIAGGDLDLLRAGAVAAIYSLVAAWAERSGMQSLDAGRSPALASDPQAVYKRKWGFVPAAEPLSPLLALWAGPGDAQDQLRQVLGRQLIVA